MPDIYSFLQTAYRFVKSLVVNVTKKMYRTASVLTAGFTVVTVVAFSSGNFHGAGKNAAAAFHEDDGKDAELPDEMQLEEELSFGTGMEVLLTASGEEGQRMVGSLLERSIQDQLAKSALEMEAVEEEVLMQARQAEEEAKEKKRREQAVIRYSNQDYDVLTRIVEAEAGVCDDEGKILVANVIINRIKNEEFPDTVTDVVYEKSQFSPVLDGTIDTCRVSSRTIECVDRALAGEDYSHGALYFMNRKSSERSNVRWFDKRLTFIKQHGVHEFFK